MSNIIKILRIRKGLTQEELGGYLGVKKSAIQKYESGAIVNLKAGTIRKLSKLFNVPSHYFLYTEIKYEQLQSELIANSDTLNSVGLLKVLEYINDIQKIGAYRT